MPHQGRDGIPVRRCENPEAGSVYAESTGGMTRFFSRNLNFQSRMARGVLGTILLMAGIIMADFELWLCFVLVGLGLFAIFEALRGWCLARACGFKNRSEASHHTNQH